MSQHNLNGNDPVQLWKRISFFLLGILIFLTIPPQLNEQAPFTFYFDIITGEESKRDKDHGSENRISPYQYELTFTSTLDEYSRPEDSLTMVRLGKYHDKPIYGYVKWYNLKPKRYRYRGEWYNGEGNVVFINKMNLNPTQKQWLTWTWIRMNKKEHVPGVWRFKIYLDDDLVANEKFTVIK